MFGFLLNLLTVALQSYTIYFLNSKFPETGKQVEDDIKGASGSSLELSDGPIPSGIENLQTGSTQPSPDNEAQASKPAGESLSSRISLQNAPKDSPASSLSNPQTGDSSIPTPFGNIPKAPVNPFNSQAGGISMPSPPFGNASGASASSSNPQTGDSSPRANPPENARETSEGS